MLPDFERYQGVVLRKIVVNSVSSLLVQPFRAQGRINAYVLNERIGVFIKHSSDRMSPWRFTFHHDQASDVLALERKHKGSYSVFVCGDDGVVTIEIAALRRLVPLTSTKQSWVRIERRPRSWYEVTGSRGILDNKVPAGVHKITDVL
jgi:hypothetical protein